MAKKPKITYRKEVASTRIFRVEEIALEFSNGEKRIYERMVSGRSGAVMIVSITDNNELLLIREYSAGTDDYQLAFPKGLKEDGETTFESANRELKEEIGFGAKDFKLLKKVSLAPGYFTHQMEIVLAQSLYPESLPGDEPEPLEVVPWPLDQVDELLEHTDFTEARSIAGLYLALKFLNKD